jgi:hypothetical protein
MVAASSGVRGEDGTTIGGGGGDRREPKLKLIQPVRGMRVPIKMIEEKVFIEGLAVFIGSDGAGCPGIHAR